MRDFIELSTVGEILLEEFMIPQNISEDKIAIDLEIPVSQKSFNR